MKIVKALPWMDNAACKGLDSELFFPETKGEQVREAKAVCKECPVRRECLEYALENHERCGVWGGTSPKQRQAIAQMRKLLEERRTVG